MARMRRPSETSSLSIVSIDAAVAHHGDAVGDGENLAQMVRDIDDGDAFGAQAA